MDVVMSKLEELESEWKFFEPMVRDLSPSLSELCENMLAALLIAEAMLRARRESEAAIEDLKFEKAFAQDETASAEAAGLAVIATLEKENARLRDALENAHYCLVQGGPLKLRIKNACYEMEEALK